MINALRCDLGTNLSNRCGACHGRFDGDRHYPLQHGQELTRRQWPLAFLRIAAICEYCEYSILRHTWDEYAKPNLDKNYYSQLRMVLISDEALKYGILSWLREKAFIDSRLYRNGYRTAHFVGWPCECQREARIKSRRA